MSSDPTYRDAHADGLIEVSFYNRDVEAGKDNPALHLIAARADKKITPRSTITQCGLVITPMYNEWRDRAAAEALLQGPTGCVTCLASMVPSDQ